MPVIKFSRIWKIAYPIIIGNVAQNLLSITDTAFVGHVDPVSLGASALGAVFYMAVIMLGMGFSIGIQIIVARRYGEAQYQSIGTVLHHALIFIIPFSGIVWGLLQYGSNDILSVLVKDPEILRATALFFDARIDGIFFGFIIFVCQAFLVGIARTKFISYVTCIMVVTNILFDWILIFGHFGFDAMGIQGAALASVLAEIAAVLIYCVYIFRKKDFRKYGLFGRIAYSKTVMANLVKVSIPASLQNFISVASWFIFFIMVEKIGQQELAISNIGRSLYTIFLLPVWGFSSAVNSLVSYSIGCRKPLLVYPVMQKVIVLTAIAVLALELLTVMFSGFVTSIYTNIPALGEATVVIIPSICISAMLFGIGFICFNTVSGTGNTHISLMIEIVATTAYLVIVIMAVETWRWGITYVWLADGIYGVIMTVASLTYLSAGRWMQKKL